MTLDPADRLAPGRVAIFLFHGVVPRHRYPVRNYTRKHIDLARFREVLDGLEVRGQAVSMAEVLAAGPGGRPLPELAYVLTFDDGFRNNHDVAAPELARRGLPATFYVTTAFVDQGLASWIDQIEACVEARDEVRLELPGLAPGTWRTDAEKRALLDVVRHVVKGRRDLDPYDVARSVASQLGFRAPPHDDDLDGKLTWDHVRALARRDGFAVGGHGHTHRILEHLGDKELDEEVGTSLALLRRHLGAPVVHYSYPEGRPGCDDPRVVRRLRAGGVACCPTAQDGLNRPGDDPFRLQRIMVT